MYWIWVLVNIEELDITRRLAREGSNLSSRKKKKKKVVMLTWNSFCLAYSLSVLNILQRYSKDATTHRGLNFDMIV